MKDFCVSTVGILFAAGILLTGVHPAPALAQSDTIKPDTSKINNEQQVEQSFDELFKSLSRQPKTAAANATARLIRKRWNASGSASIDTLMGWANRAMKDKKYPSAEDLLDQVVVLMPEYAEGWNRRATLYFTTNKFGKSIADIEQALQLEPRHFGALSGLALILERLEQNEKALETWYRVLAIFPANDQAQKAVIRIEEKMTDHRT